MARVNSHDVMYSVWKSGVGWFEPRFHLHVKFSLYAPNSVTASSFFIYALGKKLRLRLV